MAMSKSLKIALNGVAGLLVFVVAALLLLLLVDANAYKQRVEAAASEALGMEVKVAGRMGIGLFPRLTLTLEEVRVRNQGADVASAKDAALGIRFFPLLRKKVEVAEIALKHSTISIERYKDGKYNFENPEAAVTLPALDVPEVSLSDAILVYADKKSGGGFEARDCRIDMRRFLLLGGKGSYRIDSLSFAAELGCRELRIKNVAVSDIKSSVAGKDGVLDFKAVTMKVFGGQGSGSIRADFSRALPEYHIRYSLPRFRIEDFFKTLTPQKVAEGPMDFFANLSMQGKTVNEMKQTANGEATLRGDNLKLSGHDLDLELSRFESTQSFNLVDAGAFFFAGPVGLAVTKGYDFASLFEGSGGTSEIRSLVSNWKIVRGVAEAQDVAMATNKHRIALRGGLDFVNERFDDVTVALVDADGCAEARQKIHGPFLSPVVEKPSILKSLAGPALKMVEKGRELLPGGKCEVFYAGLVSPPK